MFFIIYQTQQTEISRNISSYILNALYCIYVLYWHIQILRLKGRWFYMTPAYGSHMLKAALIDFNCSLLSVCVQILYLA